MKFYTFRTIIMPDKPAGYHGFAPLLPGLHTCGSTIKEVKKNLNEAIVCHVQGLIKDGEQVPKEEDAMEAVQTFSEKEFCFNCFH